MATSRRRSTPSPRKRGTGSGSNPGLGKFKEIKDRQAEKRAAGRTSWVKVSDEEDDPTIVRAWDPELFREGFIHQVEWEREVEDRKRPGKMKTIKIRRDRLCLDQDEDGEPCPGCRDNLERRYKFWLPVIWRDAPVEVDGKTKGFKDRIALLSGGQRLGDVIDRIQRKKGIKNADIELSKEGEGYNVQYHGDALDKEALSTEDKALIKDFNADKILDKYTEEFDFDSFYEEPWKQDKDEDDDDGDDDDVGERAKRRGSAFPSRSGRKSSSRSQKDDEDNDDDEDDAPRQRRSSRSQAGRKKPGGLANLGKTTNKSSGEGGTSSRRRRRSR